MEIFLVALVLLVLLAVIDLIVGVSNDAVNFLNSAIGSRVAPRQVIMIVASAGIMVGVVFSGGMMEVARKGIFDPGFFTMPELMTIFLAVMLTDMVLLNLFNTYGLPTSTTVSIVFELLGAAVIVSLLKIQDEGQSLAALAAYINTSKALMIIGGILLSVVLAFLCGALVQFFTRLTFTFDYARRWRRYGAFWAGLSMAVITYFILIKGAKGASFILPAGKVWIKANGWLIMGAIFVLSTALFHLLQRWRRNILKPLILVGTFALALAFAANDLVNFIGVPMAGLHSYQAALASAAPQTIKMSMLARTVPCQSWLLLIAGGIMVITLWISRKARTVTETEIGLGQQDEGIERFGSSSLSRAIVRLGLGLGELSRILLPRLWRTVLARRFDTTVYQAEPDRDNRPSFDLIRASVNLMVASALVSYATSRKLPLSTTYVTFMVAMGSSFADKAWGRESAVYRVTGVLTVIGGWFMTAASAFSICGVYAAAIHLGGAYGAVATLCLSVLLLWGSNRVYNQRLKRKETGEVFNLRKVTDRQKAVAATFAHISLLTQEIGSSLDRVLQGLFTGNIYLLNQEKQKCRRIQDWTDIICANVFKAMRLAQQEKKAGAAKYHHAIRRLQKLADGHRDTVERCVRHIGNHHKNLLPEQIEDLQKVRSNMKAIVAAMAAALKGDNPANMACLLGEYDRLQSLTCICDRAQKQRIESNQSKTRLSILYYAIMGNAMMVAKQNIKLVEIFNEAFGQPATGEAFDLE